MTSLLLDFILLICSPSFLLFSFSSLFFYSPEILPLHLTSLFLSRLPSRLRLSSSLLPLFCSASLRAAGQSGSVGTGQPVVNAVRSDSALIGGTFPSVTPPLSSIMRQELSAKKEQMLWCLSIRYSLTPHKTLQWDDGYNSRVILPMWVLEFCGDLSFVLKYLLVWYVFIKLACCVAVWMKSPELSLKQRDCVWTHTQETTTN